MKKIIKKFWGVGLVLILLSTLLVGAVPQASAWPYNFVNSLGTPNSVVTDTTLAPNAVGNVAGFGILDVDQSGATVIATATDNAGTDYIYRSLNGGETWAQVIPVIGPVAGNWSMVAIAPDDPNTFAVVDSAPNPDIVYLTDNGGVTFSPLTALAAGTWINDVDISPLFGFRYLTIVGNNMSAAIPSTNKSGGICLTWTVGVLAPAWAAPAGFPSCNDVDAVAYSPNFAADQAMFIVSSNISQEGTTLMSPRVAHTALHVYSYNTFVWDANVDVTFPRQLEVAATTAVAANITSTNRAQIVLDPNFYLGDAAAQIGFIGASITVAGATEVGGVYRIGTYTAAGGNYTLTQIMTGTGINSVAWDGTNLMAAQTDRASLPNAGLVIWRTSTGLAPIVTWLQNSSFKTPGTGSYPLVLFNSTSGNGYCFSQGKNSAVARTTDYGLSFNGIALVNSHFGNMIDYWVSPDASRVYALTSDNYDMNLWRRDSGVWQRVFILPGAGAPTVATQLITQTWLVRSSATDTDAVYLGKKGATNMYKSLDGGDFVWSVRASSTAIADFAVQDASTVYVASSATGAVVKSVTGAFTWLPPVSCMGLGNVGGFGFSLNLLADDMVLVGGTTGGVAYSADGGTTFTYLGNAGGGTTLVDATGLATGDTIFALTTGAAGFAYYWTLGSSVLFLPGQATVAATGMVYADSVLYIYDITAAPAGARLYRYLYPTVPALFAVGATDNPLIAQNFSQTNMVNSLQAVVGSVSLYARNADNGAVLVPDTINVYDDYLTGAEDAPVPTYPINDAIIPINSISGIVNAFTFQWEASPTIAMTGAPFNTLYNYDLIVYLDEAATIPFAGATALTPVLAVNSLAPTLATGSAFAASDTAFAGVPGTAYYWRVRVSANIPVLSYWSPMYSFNVQQLEAIVPVISSPENGTEVNSTMPAFSWSPIANATSYQFELATDADFTDIIYSATPSSAGAQADVELTRGGQYFWRVKALTPTEGEWSTVANFIVAELPPETEPPVTITTAPAPTVTAVVTQPAATTTVVTVPPDVIEEVNPSYIWAIIIIGAVLVIAVIVLIVRTRRSV